MLRRPRGGLRVFLHLWAAPATLLGLVPVPLVLLQQGSVRIVGGVLEVHGGVVTRLLRGPLPGVGSAAALTLGHVVWGLDRQTLDRTRAHERIHVAQYERWGPCFLPAYLGASLLAWLRGQHPYLDNPFERAAFEATTTDRPA